LNREQIILKTYVDRFRSVFRTRLVGIIGLSLATGVSFSPGVATLYLIVHGALLGLYIWAVEHAARHLDDPSTSARLNRRSVVLSFLGAWPAVMLALYVNAIAPNLQPECVLLLISLVILMGLQVHLSNLGFAASLAPPILGLGLVGWPHNPGSAYPHLFGGMLFLLVVLSVAWRQKDSDRLSALEAAELEIALANSQEQTLRAEAASRSKTEFLAVTSHEVRTPLNAVLAMAGVLARESPTPRQAELAHGIQLAGGMLLRLLNGVLDFVRMEAGKVSLELAPTDMGAVLEGIGAVWRAKCDEVSVTLTIKVRGAAEDLIVAADAGRLEQVLVNLLSNAVKLSPAGQDIVVRVRARGLEADRSRLRFEVLDRGPGVAAEDRERIFEAFEQTESGRSVGGAGLGLAICRRSIELMGGKIGVEDRPGGGSTFWFEIEAAKTEAPALIQDHVEPPHDFHLRILAADDNPSNRTVLTLMLGPLDVQLDLVENGAEAVRAAALARYDVILMDAKMPVMDGETAIREIRVAEAGSGRRTPILMLTANVFPDDVARYLAAGADEVAAKPIDIQALYAALHALTAPPEDAADAAEDELAREAG